MENYKLDGDFKALSEAQESKQDELLDLPNVVGVGLGHKIKNGKETSENTLLVFVEQKVEKNELPKDALVPTKIDNIKTDVIEIGPVYAQSDPVLNNRLRPFPAGFSIAHFRVTAGTAAALAVDRGATSSSKYYVLSNCHVLANSGAAAVNDAVYQPGPFDGGTSADRVGRLSRFIPIVFSTTANNKVDCAIAELDSLEYFGGHIHGIGHPRGVGVISVGSKVQKSGRTTGYTRSSVMAINATINVGFGTFGTARFVNQIVTSAMSAGGDSGSLVLDMDGNAVGLLFAGSTSATILNPISEVLDALNIEIV
jgi:hypothetical protein